MSLQQIHQKEIVHLDLQPSNLLVIDDLDEDTKSSILSEHKKEKFENTSNAESHSQYSCHDGDQQKIIHITNFCNSSGFTRKKFSTN